MAYDTRTKSLAEVKAQALQEKYPENTYKVQGYMFSPSNQALTWGVVEYIPYCGQMPWKHNGFMWIF